MMKEYQSRTRTAVVYDERMLDHRCLWEDHPERPERLTSVLQRCTELGLLDRSDCVRLPTRLATEAEITSVHSQEQYTKLAEVCGGENIDRLKEFASCYDSVFVHPATFHSARLACGSTLELVNSILRGEVRNGMAIVRPPGHHATAEEYCGYSFFNNVAVAARQALDSGLAGRILIVDFDVHHGQGTQQAFYNDTRVLYFSTHRYEFGTFWPHLRESDFNWTGGGGSGAGAGFNCNLPLNAVGMGDVEFLAVWHQLLLPLAQQFRPDLVLVSAGFDSALGDPKGLMRLTPQCYAHLVAPLMGLAGGSDGRVALVLEGGYCLKALAEGAAVCLRTLLGDPCPQLPRAIGRPMPELVDAVLNSISMLQVQWAFPVNKSGGDCGAEGDGNDNADFPCHIPVVKYNWVEEPKSRPKRYPITDSNPVSTFEHASASGGLGGSPTEVELELERLIEAMYDLKVHVPEFRVGVVDVGDGDAGMWHKAPSLRELVQDVVNGVCGLGIGVRSPIPSDSDTDSSLAEISSYALDTLGVGRVMQLTICGEGISTSLPSPSDDDRTLQFQFVISSSSYSDDEVEQPTVKNFIRLAFQDGALLTFCTSIILPIAYEFGPDLILINYQLQSASEQFSSVDALMRMIQMLRPLAGGKMAVILPREREQITALALLLGGSGDSPPTVDIDVKTNYCNYDCDQLRRAINKYAKHWTVLEPFRKRIPKASDTGPEIGTYK